MLGLKLNMPLMNRHKRRCDAVEVMSDIAALAVLIAL